VRETRICIRSLSTIGFASANGYGADFFTGCNRSRVRRLGCATEPGRALCGNGVSSVLGSACFSIASGSHDSPTGARGQPTSRCALCREQCREIVCLGNFYGLLWAPCAGPILGLMLTASDSRAGSAVGRLLAAVVCTGRWRLRWESRCWPAAGVFCVEAFVVVYVWIRRGSGLPSYLAWLPIALAGTRICLRVFRS